MCPDVGSCDAIPSDLGGGDFHSLLWQRSGGVLSQSPPRGPAPTVFGGAATRAGESEGLDLTVDLFEAYDDDLLAAEGTGDAADRPARTSSTGGLYSGLGVGLLYQRTGESGQLQIVGNQRGPLLP